MENIDAWAARQGYYGARWIAPGYRLIAINGTLFGAGQIITGDLDTVTDRWTYPNMGAALMAALDWAVDDWLDEPTGWIRHQPSNRRRVYDGRGGYVEEVRP